MADTWIVSHGRGLLQRNKQIVIARRRSIQRDIIIKYRFPSLSVTVSHGKLKNELRTRDNHELRLSVNPEDDFTERWGCCTAMCYIVNLSSLAPSPVVKSCPHLITIFAVRGTTVTFYRCEPLVRSRGICVVPGILLFALPHAYSREKRGFARDPIQQRGARTSRSKEARITSANPGFGWRNSRRHMILLKLKKKLFRIIV